MVAYWIPAVLTGVGAPRTDWNKRFLYGWWAWEGGNGGPHRDIYPSAKFNWLNTMTPMPGSRDFNSVGVQWYPLWATGVAGTVKTLRQDRYRGIVTALKSGDPFNTYFRKPLLAGLSTWVSGSTTGNLTYAANVVRTGAAWELP